MTVEVTQADRDAAAALFLDVLQPIGSYAEWCYSSDRERAELEMAEAFARHRIAHRGQAPTPTVKDSLTGDVAELVESLPGLAVWPVSVADHHADILTPRQIEKLYAAHNAMHEAATKLTELAAEVERLRAEKD